MKRIIGWGVGVFYLVLSFAAFSFASAGRADGRGEVGFWFSVVGTLLFVAALAAFIGTWLHTRQRSEMKASGAH
jgi:protein-S-isoprenylcysteine O-methyltransferase Ste14